MVKLNYHKQCNIRNIYDGGVRVEINVKVRWVLTSRWRQKEATMIRTDERYSKWRNLEELGGTTAAPPQA